MLTSLREACTTVFSLVLSLVALVVANPVLFFICLYKQLLLIDFIVAARGLYNRLTLDSISIRTRCRKFGIFLRTSIFMSVQTTLPPSKFMSVQTAISLTVIPIRIAARGLYPYSPLDRISSCKTGTIFYLFVQTTLSTPRPPLVCTDHVPYQVPA